MKKILATVLMSFLAAGVWGANAVNSVQSTNMFGTIKVTGVASNLFVAVPFEDFNGNAFAASNVVHAVGLADGTKMFVWNPAANSYSVYAVSNDSQSASGFWTTPVKITLTAEGATLGTADLATHAAVGTGIVIERKDVQQPVYVYGQIPTSVQAPTFSAGPTLVCVPSTNALAAVDLNAFSWSGVTATGATLQQGQETTDYIQFCDSANRLVRYFYREGQGWVLDPAQASLYPDLAESGKALVPAGTAFWYYSKSGGASVRW